MVVARFTPVTGWAGRSITYEGGQFALDGHGPLAAWEVLRYDQQRQIVWEYDGLCEWVAQVAGTATSSPPPYGYAVDPQYFQAHKLPSPPGIAVAGFVLALAGFIFPVLVFWWVGLALSWPGYMQAVREKLPTGLALAGLIINAVMTASSVMFLLVVILLVAAG